MALAPIDEALKRIRRGEMVLVVDDEDRENEGDLTMAASWVNGDSINFMLRWARGLVCMPFCGEHLSHLDLRPMVPPDEAGCDTAFTVSIDHLGAGSGIGAADRALTIQRAIDVGARPSEFRRPGHVFPLPRPPGRCARAARPHRDGRRPRPARRPAAGRGHLRGPPRRRLAGPLPVPRDVRDRAPHRDDLGRPGRRVPDGPGLGRPLPAPLLL